MTFKLDILLGIIVAIISVCAFSLEIGSSPKESRWLTLPPHIRLSVHITAWIFMIRAVDFFTLSKVEAPVVGHADWIALAATLSLAVTVLLLTVYAASIRLPALAWERVRHVAEFMRQHPDSAPVMMSSGDVMEAHHAAGQPASAGLDPRSVPRESARAQRMSERA